MARAGTLYPHVDAANKYARDIVRGRIPACEYVKLACGRHLDDLKKYPGRAGKYYFDKAKAQRACRFIEKLPHIKGKWASRREDIRLAPWQSFIVCSLFGWMNAAGFRRFTEAYNEIARKNAKSTLAAAIGLYMFCADGEYGAEVYSGATSERQAWEVFGVAHAMAKRTPDLCEHYGIAINAKSLTIPERACKFEPLTGSPGDGSNPSCAIIDEFHEHRSDDLYNTMITGMDARDQPLAFIITTAGDNIGGACYQKRDYAIKVLNGAIVNDAFFAIIYTIDKRDKWNSERALIKANPNYGISINADRLRQKQIAAAQSPSAQAAFKTKNLNQWIGARSAWLNMVTWNAAPPRPPLQEMAGRECVAAFDLASKIDIAAAGWLFPPDKPGGIWSYYGKYYLPEDILDRKENPNVHLYKQWAESGHLILTPGNVIDHERIIADAVEMGKAHQVELSGYDNWNATLFATMLSKKGAKMIEVPITPKTFTEPMKYLETLIMSGNLAHGDDPVLTWMASNAVAKKDKSGAKENLFIGKENDHNKIDGIVALIMCMALSYNPAADEKPSNIYNNMELMIV